MQPKDFTNLFFKNYAVKISESHNLSFEHALLKPGVDKKNDVTKIVTGLGLPSSIKTMYDYRIHFDVDYDRLYQLCVINLCTEIEYFFKELYNFFSLTKPATEKGNFSRDSGQLSRIFKEIIVLILIPSGLKSMMWHLHSKFGICVYITWESLTVTFIQKLPGEGY